MAEDDGYWALVAPVWGRVNIHGSPDEFARDFAGLDTVQQHLFAAQWVRSEVDNGGLHQFFTNPTGVLAPEAVAGLRAIGLPGCARVVEEAMAFFGVPYPRGQAERERVLADVGGEEREEWDPFYHLDDDFGELCAEENGGFLVAADTYAARVAA